MDGFKQSNDPAVQSPDQIIDGTRLPAGKRYRDPIVLDVDDDLNIEDGSGEIESGEVIPQQAKRMTDLEIDHVNVVVDEIMSLPRIYGLTVKCESGNETEFSDVKIGEIYILSLKFGKTRPVSDVGMFSINGLEHPHVVRGYIRKSIRYGGTYTTLRIIVSKIQPVLIWEVLDFYDSAKKPHPNAKKPKVDPQKEDPLRVEIIKTLVDRWSPIVRAEVKEQILREERLSFAKNSPITDAEKVMIDDIVSRFINKQ